MSDQILPVSISLVLTASVFIAGFLSLRQHQLLNIARDSADAAMKDLRDASSRRRVSAYEFLDILDQLIEHMQPDRATKATITALFISGLFLAMLGLVYIYRADFEGAASLAVIIILTVDAIIIWLSVLDLREVNSSFVDQLDRMFHEVVPAAVLRLADISDQERILKEKDHRKPYNKQFPSFLFRNRDRHKGNDQIASVTSFYGYTGSHGPSAQGESQWDIKVDALVDKLRGSTFFTTPELSIGSLRLKAKIESNRSDPGSLLSRACQNDLNIPEWVTLLSDARVEAMMLFSTSDSIGKPLMADINRQVLDLVKRGLGGFIDSYRSPYDEDDRLNGPLDCLLRVLVLEAERHLRNTPGDVSILLLLAKTKACFREYVEALKLSWKLIELDPISPIGVMTMFVVAFMSPRLKREDLDIKLAPELREVLEDDLREDVDPLNLLKIIRAPLLQYPVPEQNQFKLDRELFKIVDHYMSLQDCLVDPKWATSIGYSRAQWTDELATLVRRLAELNPLLSSVRTAWEFAQSERISDAARKIIRSKLEQLDDPHDPKIDRPLW